MTVYINDVPYLFLFEVSQYDQYVHHPFSFRQTHPSSNINTTTSTSTPLPHFLYSRKTPFRICHHPRTTPHSLSTSIHEPNHILHKTSPFPLNKIYNLSLTTIIRFRYIIQLIKYNVNLYI